VKSKFCREVKLVLANLCLWLESLELYNLESTFGPSKVGYDW